MRGNARADFRHHFGAVAGHGSGCVVKGGNGRWIDPAPLEVARPRLPWWTMLPGKAKLVLLPVVLVWFAVWVTAKFVRMSWYYPLTVASAVLGLLVCNVGGWWLLGGLVVPVVAGLAVWWWQAPDVFTRRMAWARSEFRRVAVYAWQWRTVMRLASLTGKAGRREHLPKLKRVRSEWWRDRVRVRMVKGQAPEQWELRASGLAHSFGAGSCRVRVVKPGRLELDLMRADPLANPIPLPALDTAATVNLKKVPVGRTETGKPWCLRLLGGHLLTVGATGAGKGSVLWALVWALAPMVRAGVVRLVGIDPKGGMELGQCPEVFSELAYDDPEEAVELLEKVASDVRARATRFRGVRRTWTKDSGVPFTVLIVDELAALIAYLPDKRLRERAQAALQVITSQGRAPGVCVVGFVQDPRKEVVPFRNLFPTRVAMRLDEAAQVDMVLGDGVRQRGAAAHEIAESTPGVAWVKHDGQREPVRARAFLVTDTNLIELRNEITGGSAVIVPFPDTDDFTSGGTAA